MDCHLNSVFYFLAHLSVVRRAIVTPCDHRTIIVFALFDPLSVLAMEIAAYVTYFTVHIP